MRRFCLSALLLAAFTASAAHASVALLMEEPYGEFGAYNPTGHAAVYLNHICAESPLQLRPCRQGEYGVVISRYHKIDHKDWIAMPLVPYLYGVDTIDEIPKSVTKADVARIRDAYWRANLTSIVPPGPGNTTPKGEWTQLVGSSFDRRIHGFQIETTPEQDARFIAIFNDKRNVGHFNLLVHNCADFSRVVLNNYFPHAIHRNYISDVGVMTPKQAARSLVAYGRKHPELKMEKFVINQVPGTVARSHAVDGVEESLVRSKKYMLPLIILQPEVAGAAVVGYLSDGRLHLPKDAPVFEIGDDVQPVAAPDSSPRHPLTTPASTTTPAETPTT